MGYCTNLNKWLNTLSFLGLSVTSLCLIALIFLNVYVKRYTAAMLITSMVIVYRTVKWWSAESRAMNSSVPNTLQIVNRVNQTKLVEQLERIAPNIPTSKNRLMIGNIEAVVNKPKSESENANICFVLTHPWGILGGDMNNNVPKEVGKILNTFGYPSVRFNFRGIGRSRGCCTWRGYGERNDLKAVVEWILSKDGIPNVESIVLVGYSYGSMISNSCADLFPQIKAFVSIATPFPCYWGLSLFNCALFNKLARMTKKPKLFLCGDEDDFTGKRKYKKYTKAFDANKSVYLIRGVDHSWYGYEGVAAALILRFVKDKT
jgi:uncharacterized protein